MSLRSTSPRSPCRRERDVGGDLAGSTAASLGAAARRNGDGRGDRPAISERLVERDVIVGAADRPGESRAGRGERREAELLDVWALPMSHRLGITETARRMELMKMRNAPAPALDRESPSQCSSCS